SYQGIKDVLDWLVDKGIARDPPLMNIMMGFHGFCHGSPLGPRSMELHLHDDHAADTRAKGGQGRLCRRPQLDAILHAGDNAWLRHGARGYGRHGVPISPPGGENSDFRASSA